MYQEQQKQLTNFIEVMRQIAYKPEMYLGDRRISSIFHFVQGYLFAVLIVHKKEGENKVVQNFSMFHEFTANKLNKKLNGFGWLGMMLEHCNGDEEKAFEFFYESFEEFIVEQNEKI